MENKERDRGERDYRLVSTFEHLLYFPRFFKSLKYVSAVPTPNACSLVHCNDCKEITDFEISLRTSHRKNWRISVTTTQAFGSSTEAWQPMRLGS